MAKSAEKAILIGGIGGQGIVYATTLLAKALFLQGHYVAQLQSYGAEVRGGAVIGWVVYSKHPIIAPFTDTFDLVLVLHQKALEEIKKRGYTYTKLVAESDLVSSTVEAHYRYPIYRVARETGLEGSENIIALGVLAGHGIVSREVLRNLVGSDEKNTRALEEGVRLVQNTWPPTTSS